MDNKTKITEVKENYSVKRPVKNDAGERTYEEKNFVRYKDVICVDGWARFGHYILDTIFYYLFAFILAVPFFGLLMLLGADIESISNSRFVDLLSWVIFYPGYYLLFESTMQSTPGKLILGRIVVNEYGEKPSFSAILGRSYSRIVPFEALSCLSDRGWHDKWTDTYVMRKKDLYELQLAIKAMEFDKGTENTMAV